MAVKSDNHHRDLLLAKTAHEINNLAMSLSANLKTLSAVLKRNGAEKEPVPDLIEDMNDCVARMSGILRQITKHASLTRSERKKINPGKLIESALKIATPGFENDVTVVEPACLNLPDITGDETLLCQLFVNLLQNAAVAMRGQKRKKIITIKALVENGDLIVSIGDTGSGMSPEVKENLFKPFFSTRKDNGGTGLGLFISKEIVASHNGCLTVESCQGKGSEFTVRLPIHV